MFFVAAASASYIRQLVYRLLENRSRIFSAHTVNDLWPPSFTVGKTANWSAVEVGRFNAGCCLLNGVANVCQLNLFSRSTHLDRGQCALGIYRTHVYISPYSSSHQAELRRRPVPKVITLRLYLFTRQQIALFVESTAVMAT